VSQSQKVISLHILLVKDEFTASAKNKHIKEKWLIILFSFSPADASKIYLSCKKIFTMYLTKW
jgi:hypothetical protein